MNSTASNFAYDNIYQLTGVSGAVSESYTFDPVGNRLTSASVPNYSYNSSNELTGSGSATYTYDSNGNILTKTSPAGATTYTWDFENRLTSVQQPGPTTVTFKYDPFGRRIEKGSSVYVYDGANLIEETDLGGNMVARYVFGSGIDEPLAGREWDSETGLYDYRARYYDPAIGRFLSEDPIGFKGGFNFYVYVMNEPTTLIDPFGLQSPGQQMAQALSSINPGPIDVTGRSNVSYPERLFGTRWCGPGGAGPPVSGRSHELDVACKEHDDCYDANGITISDNWPSSPEAFQQLRANGKLAALQKCNKDLCDKTKKLKGIAPWLVWAYFYEFGAGNVDSQLHQPVSRPHPLDWDWRHPIKTLF